MHTHDLCLCAGIGFKVLGIVIDKAILYRIVAQLWSALAFFVPFYFNNNTSEDNAYRELQCVEPNPEACNLTAHEIATINTLLTTPGNESCIFNMTLAGRSTQVVVGL